MGHGAGTSLMKMFLFHHLVVLIFKFFPELEFIEDMYRKYMLESTDICLSNLMFYWLQ